MLPTAAGLVSNTEGDAALVGVTVTTEDEAVVVHLQMMVGLAATIVAGVVVLHRLLAELMMVWVAAATITVVDQATKLGVTAMPLGAAVELPLPLMTQHVAEAGGLLVRGPCPHPLPLTAILPPLKRAPRKDTLMQRMNKESRNGNAKIMRHG